MELSVHEEALLERNEDGAVTVLLLESIPPVELRVQRRNCASLPNDSCFLQSWLSDLLSWYLCGACQYIFVVIALGKVDGL